MVTDTVERLSATGTKKAALRGVSRPPEPAGVRGEGREAEGASLCYSGPSGPLPAGCVLPGFWQYRRKDIA